MYLIDESWLVILPYMCIQLNANILCRIWKWGMYWLYCEALFTFMVLKHFYCDLKRLQQPQSFESFKMSSVLEIFGWLLLQCVINQKKLSNTVKLPRYRLKKLGTKDRERLIRQYPLYTMYNRNPVDTYFEIKT